MADVLVLIIVVAAAIAVVAVIARRGRHAEEVSALREQFGEMGEVLRRMDERFLGVTKHVGEMVQRSQSDIHRSLSETGGILREVTGRLAKTEEYHRYLVEVSSHVRELGNVLQAPKLRGELGEQLLAELLAQMLPKEFFALQYPFRGGETVDAAILLRDLVVPVDAKFPLENFRRAVQSSDEGETQRYRREFLNDARKHITAIKNKYIRPDEGTSDFAFMYIPAENVFYDIMIRDDENRELRQYALAQNVFPVSPNSFYAYLALVLKGLRALQLEEGAREILGHVQRVRAELHQFEEDFSVLGKHLENAAKKYDESGKRLVRLGEKVGQLEAPSASAPAELAEGAKSEG